jgi:simple sugar transport system ATP-binding protein
VSAEAPALELRGITKRFGPVVANDGIDFDLRPGEVHALLGENGAGKSTLMSILYGLYRPDEGEIRVNDELVEMDSPARAIELGIGMVHQHFMLVPVMTVTENIVLGGEPRRRGGLLDVREGARRVAELSERYGLAVDPDAVIEDVTVGAQQRVEILKTLYRDARILVLDEPTAVLTAQETAELFEVLRALQADGVAIVFISHKLGEVLEIADRVTVLRRGKKVDTVPTAGASEQSLARLMVGRDVLLQVEKPAIEPGPPVLEVEDLRVRDDRELEAVRGLSLTVRGGEIVALAGVDGNGQHELVEAIAGLRDADSGRIVVAGQDVRGRGVQATCDAGVAHIPEDRQVRGLVLDFTLAENLALREYRSRPLSRAGWLNIGHMNARARSLLGEFDVRGGDAATLAASLSGGNQQKVCIARELASNPSLLIAHQPTRGLDVGAIEFVHRRLVAERDNGRGVLLVSLESEEVRSLADRILVIYEGRIVGEFPPDATEEELGFAMTGGGSGRAAA